ncbi:hypothetical protein EDD22DRAFT_146480 [Suillus occidentalis]|nr:hypothetical protein EDD22DRAFT_410192 [Suillus occidentalis]KAG1759330.1 hypothetical protein EDD22DRAFT_146480 [Suillus occidentalis]
MAPATLFGVLPDPYWTNFCHLARGLRLMQQYHISRSELLDGHQHLLDFADEFEEIYYQRRNDRLHFIRPWIHSLTHIGPETVNKGPPICSSQWTMERTIGNLGQEIRLHNSSVYANLSQRAIRRCQINALKAIIPTIEPSTNALPKGSLDLGDGYILLRRRERSAHSVRPCESDAIIQYLATNHIHIATAPPITRWARLRLPNGQVARSAWKENGMSKQPRMARNVKLFVDGHTSIAEVYFYFNMTIHDRQKTFALVSEFSQPHPELLEQSFQTVFACRHHGDNSLRLIEVSTIQAVVAMVPHQFPGIDGTLFYLIERPGLDLLTMGGAGEDIMDEE